MEPEAIIGPRKRTKSRGQGTTSPDPAAPAHAGPGRILGSLHAAWISLQIRHTIFRLVWRLYGNPAACIRVLRALDAKRRAILGEHRLQKLAFAGGLYYWDMYTPGWPSPAFNAHIMGEAARIRTAPGKKTNRFTNIFIAITKKCSLQCEHCFEWDALNGREVLGLQDLKHMVQAFQERGTGLIQLTGGEPMLRLDDMTAVLSGAGKDSQFWMLTSGFKLTDASAHRLRIAGLRGVAISLDHFDPEMHNAFRGFRNAYAWVEEGVRAAHAAGLVVALTICATRSFVSEANLMAYAALAKDLGVSFIQILEPKAVGHYKSKEVCLSPEQEQLIEAFYLRMNYERSFRSYPIVTYHGYHQRRTGCFGAGNRNLYVDTDGDLHACPFCQTKRGSAIRGDLDEAIAYLQATGCHGFKNTSL